MAAISGALPQPACRQCTSLRTSYLSCNAAFTTRFRNERATYRTTPLRTRAEAATAAAAAAAAEPAAVEAAPQPAFDIRPWQCREDLERAAWLRAEAYYENRSVGRFKASFVKQFAGQEFYALQRRTQGAEPQCLTLVASAASSTAGAGSKGPVTGPGSCLGTLDVRLLNEAVAAFIDKYGGSWPDGVPREAAAAAYVSNVVVAASHRGRGLGKQLVHAAAALARERWAAAKVYCHVEIENEPALALYRSCGFQPLGEELPPEEEGQGRRLLLCLAPADGGS